MKILMSVLREIVITCDVLLGGNHRSYGHQPPLNVKPPTRPPPKPPGWRG